MNIVACQYCGAVSDWWTCVQIYGKLKDYYGEFTKCPTCGSCLYRDEVSKIKTEFEYEKLKINKQP